MDNLRELIEACSKNNSASQKVLYERYYGYALKIVFRYVYRYERAVDAVNDGLSSYSGISTGSLQTIMSTLSSALWDG